MSGIILTEGSLVLSGEGHFISFFFIGDHEAIFLLFSNFKKLGLQID
jgi:hypothetical protein